MSAINRDGYFYLLICAEIWDAERWNAYNEENAEDVGELAEQLADLDLGI